MNRRHTQHPRRRIGLCRLTVVFGMFSLASASAQTAPTGWTQVGPSVYHLTSGAGTVPLSFWGTYVQNGGSVTASQGTVRLGDIVVGTSVATIYTIGSCTFTAGQLMMGFSGTGNGYFTQDGGTVYPRRICDVLKLMPKRKTFFCRQ